MAGLCEGGNEPADSLKAICYDGWINFENETQDRQEWRNVICEREGKDSGFSYDLLDGARTTFRGMVLRDQPGEYCRRNGRTYYEHSLMLAGNEFQSLGSSIVKEDEYEEVRWDGIVSIVSWRERVFRLCCCYYCYYYYCYCCYYYYYYYCYCYYCYSCCYYCYYYYYYCYSCCYYYCYYYYYYY
ncbi:hypothetical protein ANN_23971 [Periplaneta americana]|uniref:Uncharacterized protein n=1 Tax=Periplaneta americana TaxID=6978 RepID=A0ABQ8S1S4_PERAM|nr:hypothetical protein ANN_23971 [Periplaneta americana]